MKTSTRIAFIFTLFTSILLVVFIVVLNVYYFYNWKSDEKKEVLDKTESIAEHIFWSQSGSLEIPHEEMNRFIARILEQWGMLQTADGGSFVSPRWNNERSNFFWLYQSWSNWSVRYTFPFRKIWTVGLPYDITEHIHGQWSLLQTSSFLIVIFFLVIAIISFFFARSSLRSLSKIVQYIHSFRVDSPLPEFPLSGPKKDELVIVAEALSEAFRKVQIQTETLQQFSTDAAHEFKTPLMVLRSEVDYALKSGKHREGLENIREQIRVLDTMVATLLEIARIEKWSTKKEEVNISHLLEEIIFEKEQIFSEKHLDVIKNIPKNIVISSDQSMLRIIFSNLLDNAFKYTNAGDVEVILTKNGFSIRDTGVGIEEENLHRIWDRLYREDSSRSIQSGHGLGLFLVKSIIEKLGYTIRVESKKGVGSTFLVQF